MNKEIKAENADKYYVQRLDFDCLICHQPVKLMKDGVDWRMQCGCISVSAQKFIGWSTGSVGDIVTDLDRFIECIKKQERFWAKWALSLTQPDIKQPDGSDSYVGSSGGTCKLMWNDNWDKFYQAYEKAHSEWIKEHPDEVCPLCLGEGVCDELTDELDEPTKAAKPVRRKASNPEQMSLL